MKLKLLFASLLLTNLINAQTPGDFDISFGNNGRVTTASTDMFSISDMALQSDGKIVSVGRLDTSNVNFGVVRYLPNGALDTTFGTTGILNIDFYGGNDFPNAVAIQPDGKILVAGYAAINSSSEFGILRLNPNGTLDTTFGTGGKIYIDFGLGTSTVKTITLQADGKIVVAGSAAAGSSSAQHFAVARLNIDGSLDSNFSNDGKQTKVMSSTGISCIKKVKVLPDGKMLLGGYANTSSIGLLKLLPDGSFDTSFNTDGSKIYYATSLSVGEYANMTFLPDNSMLYGSVFNNDIKIFKLDSNLDIINSFGANGSVTVDIDNSSYDQNVMRIISDSIGNFYTVGTTSTSGSTYFYIMNFTPNGALNNQFSYDGKLLITFGNSTHYAAVAILQPDSKLLVGGEYSSSYPIRGAIARVLVQAGFLGVNEKSQKETISVYPNPTKDFVNITDIDKSLLNQKVQVVDATGRVLIQENIESQNIKLNISHLNSGIYYINIGEKLSKKIIKN